MPRQYADDKKKAARKQASNRLFARHFEVLPGYWTFRFNHLTILHQSTTKPFTVPGNRVCSFHRGSCIQLTQLYTLTHVFLHHKRHMQHFDVIIEGIACMTIVRSIYLNFKINSPGSISFTDVLITIVSHKMGYLNKNPTQHVANTTWLKKTLLKNHCAWPRIQTHPPTVWPKYDFCINLDFFRFYHSFETPFLVFKITTLGIGSKR